MSKKSAHNLSAIYKKTIVSELMKELNVKNINAVPKVSKVVVNIGMGKALAGSKDYSFFAENLTKITGQKPMLSIAKKSISNFKLREGMPVGLYVTLRGEKMYSFLSKLVNIVLPRVRDFRGISARSFDGRGNYSLGLREHIVFPEINADDISKIHGLEINVITTAKNNQEAQVLLKKMGFPFQERKDKNNSN